MININSTSKRTAKDTRNDLEEVLDEDVFRKTIAWLEGEFMAKARELAQPSASHAPQNSNQETHKTHDNPKLTPPKPAALQPREPQPQEQAHPAQPPALPAETKPAANSQQQANLSKRPPEKKTTGDEEKKSIFDRIKVNREPRAENGGKPKSGQPKFDRNQQTHPQKRPYEAPAQEEGEDAKKQIKETPEEEAQRQARLDELLAKAKKVATR